MARFPCRCGNTLSNGMAPNDVELKIFTDREWDDIINLGMVDSVDLPDPKHDAWRCPICQRVYVFHENNGSLWRVYSLEMERMEDE